MWDSFVVLASFFENFSLLWLVKGVGLMDHARHPATRPPWNRGFDIGADALRISITRKPHRGGSRSHL
jgi:hypothetical protein